MIDNYKDLILIYKLMIEIEQKQEIQALETMMKWHQQHLKMSYYINNEKEFISRMRNFWKFISSYPDEKTYSVFEESKYYCDNKSFFSYMEQYYTRLLETIEVKKIMLQGENTKKYFSDLLSNNLAMDGYNQVKNEILMVDWKGKNNVVMVGCGSLPQTVLCLYDNTKAENIVGLDNNQESIYIAREMVKSINRVDRINLIHCDGLNYDYGNADLVYVANFIKPKTKVIDRIAETAKDGVNVIVRSPVSFGKMFYENALEDLNPVLSVVKEGEVNENFLFKPFVIKK